MENIITPDQLISNHASNGNKATLKVGSKFQWDRKHVSKEIPTLEAFKNEIDNFYDYKLILGYDGAVGQTVYMVTAIK
ncbi:hypothetical protein ASE74_15685 [Pedobacter sp. Leaf216]|uniref:hypothetical protein n=1 Tax=Pedobacter sp. Leaf216 TaxID=1735684 RepID=UPI00070215FC|nr:hypothetical protein [Pedobacter sp. Leaf216]KQM78143.1 hypothetical protein ASE74_15685 [Pedobacter sp. Leaf216]